MCVQQGMRHSQFDAPLISCGIKAHGAPSIICEQKDSCPNLISLAIFQTKPHRAAGSVDGPWMPLRVRVDSPWTACSRRPRLPTLTYRTPTRTPSQQQAASINIYTNHDCSRCPEPASIRR